MSTDKANTVIRDPSESPRTVKSTPSISVTLQSQVEDMIQSLTKPGALRGEPIRIIDSERFQSLTAGIVSLLESREKHTVSPIELSNLSAELASLRLKLNLFESEKQKAEFAANAAKTEVQRLESLLQEQIAINKQVAKDSALQEEAARGQLGTLRTESSRLKAAIAKAKSQSDTAMVKALTEEKQALADKITSLNNILQEANKVKADNRAAIEKYQLQLLKLNNELNALKAAQSMQSQSTFASVAAATGSATVNLYSSVAKSLSDKSKAFLKKAADSGDDDVKNKAFWLHAALDSSKAIVLKPYRALIEGMHDDIKMVDQKSRKKFLPVLNVILDVLLGKRNELTLAELDALIESIDTKKVLMANKFRNKGIITLDDFIHSGAKPLDLDEDDFMSCTSNSNKEAFLKFKSKILDERQGAKTKSKESSGEPSGKPKNHSSFYWWLRSKIVTTLVWLQGSRDHNTKPRISTRTIYWLRSKCGAVAGGLLSIPVAFMSFLTGSWW